MFRTVNTLEVSLSNTRIKLIIDKLRNNRYPATRDEILSHLADADYHITKRTFFRDMLKIQEEFGQAVKISRVEVDGKLVRGYHIDTEESVDYDDLLSFLNMASAVDVIKNTLGSSANPADYIDNGRARHSGGATWLKMLISAIVKSKKIHFSHLKYGDSEVTERFVEPYYLKFYNGIWYLLAKQDNPPEFKVFGLDRVSNVSVSDIGFEKTKQIKPSDYFKDSIGVFVDESLNIETIIIDFYKPFIDRVKATPLHSSQKIILEKDDMIRVEVAIIPSSEFYTELLKFRNHAKIISPDFVSHKMKDLIEMMSKNYR